MENELQIIEDKTRVLMLFDIYGSLLTTKARRSFSLYLNEDLSLREIADELQISRQAVHASIQKTAEHLENYEKEIHFHTTRLQTKGRLEQIHSALVDENIEEAQRILHQLLEDL